MKHFIIWISVVVLTVLSVDLIFGIPFNNYTKNHKLPGDYESIEKVLRHNDADILVLGSSVALNSINTKALQDSLGCHTFNAGGNGQTFPFYLTMLQAAIEQKVPKKVLLCIQPNALSSAGIGNRYNILAPYYGMGISDIDSNMSLNRIYDKYLLNITSYKFNKIWFRILLYHFITPDIRGENGYIGKPIPPSFPEKKPLKVKEISKERKVELQKFMQICKDNNIDLMILFTPEYNNLNIKDKEKNVISQVKEIAGLYNVRVYNDIELKPFASDSTLFYDEAHININGTKLYTDTIIKRIGDSGK